jgi:hypothetical protein
MQPMTVVRIMPVIQKVIMKQRSPYQHLSIHGKMQKLRYSTTVFRNSDAVFKNRHIAVLDKFPHPLHFGVLVILGQNGGEALTLRIRKLH